MFKSSGLDNSNGNCVLPEHICATVISLKVIHKFATNNIGGHANKGKKKLTGFSGQLHQLSQQFSD